MPAVTGTISKKAFKRAFGGGALISNGELLEGAAQEMARSPLGQAFNRALAATGAREEMATQHSDKLVDKVRALFLTFCRARFENTIVYDRDAIETAREMVSLRVHEGAHAMSYRHAACAYAVPENPRTRIFLCPRDAAILNSLLEIAAVAKQVEYDWERCVRRQNPIQTINEMNFVLWERHVSQSAATYEEFYLLFAMDYFFHDKRDENTLIADSYHNEALRLYEHCYRRPFIDYIANANLWRFARLTKKDAFEIGETFGVNVFSKHPHITRLILEGRGLSRQSLDRIADLNRYLGIANEKHLPTVEQAIAADGLTRDQFIAIGRGEMAWPEHLRDRVFGYTWEPAR